ncbi:hypothetical protein K432DRAFT_310030 [Lepidopterella palustris CBS 459.81]|uniref:Cora-domain-containing protein n=1 Tax=Lepidopterella palustris CBS 459.81 TaxID=1314670 RepID=A0A8E2DZS9_9PEZI|nr:hypothetical protein K432DRAFT_310030 [Lepidopterella palustris CBS 459.81]
MGIAEGLSCLQKIRTASGSRIQKDATVPPKVPETIKCQTKLLTHAPSRRVAQWQIARLCNEKDQLISTVQNLVDQFVPKHYPHALLSKCWGSIHAISNVIEEVCKENNDLCKQELHGNSSLIYIVKDFPDKDYMQLHNLENFAKPIQHCTLCSRSNRYPDIDDAFRHLFHFHAQMKGDLPIELYKEALGHWLVSTSGLEMEERNAKMINLISVLLRRARKLLYKSIEIRNNVADEKNQKPNNFLLPSALVKAAEKVFQFVYTAPYTVRFLQDQGKASLNTKLMGPLPMELRDNTALAEHYGVAADNALSKAQDELLLMAHTGSTDSASIVLYVSSTPETTIMIGLGCLITRHIHREMDVRELYRSHLSTLRYAAGQRPSKRILRELYLLEEEIELVATVFSQQFDLLDGLEKVFDSRHYRITNRMRINAFERIEQPMLEKLRTKYRRNLEDDIKGLQDQMAKTAQVLRYNIEIAEEGHSKAILIFTLVTIVFLPLSFVASLLGMNTVDMRSMQNTQVLFWEIALPLTAVIGGVSLLVAYRGTQIGDQFEKLLGNMQQNRSKSQGLHRSTPTSRQKPRDEEDIDAEELKPHRTASTLKRRKATEKNFIVPEKALQQAFQRKPPKSRRSIVVEERVEERRRMSGDDVVEVIEDDSDYVVRGRAFRRSRRSPRSPKRDVGIRKIDL